MPSDQATKKRKRKHGGGTREARDPPAEVAIAPPVEKKDRVRGHKKRKARKEDTPPPSPPPESEGEEEGGSEEAEDNEEGRAEDEDEEINGAIEAEDESEAAEGYSGRPRHPDADIESENPSDIPLHAKLSLPDTGEHPVLFADLNLSPGTQKAVEKMGFEKMTEVQSRTIPPLMAGRDVCLHAQLNYTLGAIC